MTRGNAHQSKVHYQGKEEDYVIFVDDVKAVQDWKNDKSIPLAQVVSGFKIFVTHKHGAQNAYDSPSKATLENEFGTNNEEECMIKILEGGTLQETEVNIKRPSFARRATTDKVCRVDSVKDRRMTQWDLAWLIEGNKSQNSKHDAQLGLGM